MWIRSSHGMTAFGILTLLGLAPGATAQETRIEINQVPKAVLDSARVNFPGAKLKEAAKEVEDGKTVYELEMTHEGRDTDANFHEDGTLIVVETKIPEKDAPSVVLKAVKAKYPDATITALESVKKGPKPKTIADRYEFHLKLANKKSAEVEVAPDGKILEAREKPAKKADHPDDEND